MSITNEDIARIIRRGLPDELQALADRLDPPKPEPGTVVWWRNPRVDDAPWNIGIIDLTGDRVIDEASFFHTARDIECRPARILALDEVAVKIPPVSEWPEFGHTLITLFEGETKAQRHRDVITRAKAERMEEER